MTEKIETQDVAAPQDIASLRDVDVDGRRLEVGDVVRDASSPHSTSPMLCVPERKGRKRRAASVRYIGHITVGDVWYIDDWRLRNADYEGVDGRTERVHVAVFIPRSSQLHTKKGALMSEEEALIEGFRCMYARGVFGYLAEKEAAT